MAKRLQRIEDAETVLVGKFYLVPTLNTIPWGLIPVTGPLHEDAEHLDFPYQHYHIDWRFARPGMGRFGDDVEFSRVFMPTNHRGESAIKTGGLHYRRWKCRRALPDFPGPERPVPWLPALETAYEGKKLAKGMICPHRGICVRNAIDPRKPYLPFDDLATCPGHGLRWNVKTGEMAPRCGPERKEDVF